MGNRFLLGFVAGPRIEQWCLAAVAVGMLLLLADGATAAEVKDAQKTECAQFLPYSPQREQLWNRVHRRLFERTTRDGRVLGCDEVDALLWPGTTHVLTEPAYSETLRLLDSFLQSHGERLVREPLRRAIFQHDLWMFFDWVVAPMADGGGPQNHPVLHLREREELARRIARMMKAVALTRAEIERLPNNFERLQRSRAKDSLPELPDPGQGWVLFGRADGITATPLHSNLISPRAVFLVYLNLPEGTPTTPYVEQLRRYSQARKAEEDCFHKACKPPQFPVGTQVALVRRAMLIDANGEAVPSPITETIQLRRYLKIAPTPQGYRRSHQEGFDAMNSQQFAEFRLRRSLLLHDQPSLHELAADETGFDARLFSEDFDYIEKYGGMPHKPLHFCAGCHLGPGVVGFMSYSQLFEGRKFFAPRATTETQEEAIAVKHLMALRQWNLLQQMMVAASDDVKMGAHSRD